MPDGEVASFVSLLQWFIDLFVRKRKGDEPRATADCERDVLAAVDAKVALTLFNSISSFVRAAPRERAVVMALNQTYLLSNFDRVIFING